MFEELRGFRDDINRFTYRIAIMSAQLDALTAEVANATTVSASAVALITGLASQLAAAIAAQKSGDDGAALQALHDSLAASDASLSAAVSANTATPATPASLPGETPPGNPTPASPAA